MEANEIPIRLGYINVTLKNLTHGHKNPLKMTADEVMEMYSSAREMAEQPLEKIIADATKKYGKNVSSLLRHKDYYGVYDVVPISKLCFDKSHEEGLPSFRGQKIKRGELLVDFYEKNKNNPEIQESIDFISRHKDFFNTYVPISVRRLGDKFEVVDGNHRSFCAIKDGDQRIPALITSKERPKDPEIGLDFTLS